MRIAICGPKRASAVSKVEDSCKISVKTPWSTDGRLTINDYAAETFRYQDDRNVVFDGSAFDFLSKREGDGYDDLNEQIALASLVNLDYIAVILDGMDKETAQVYRDYAELYPEKFHLYNFDTDFEVVLR